MPMVWLHINIHDCACTCTVARADYFEDENFEDFADTYYSLV